MQSDQSLAYSTTVKLLTKQHLEFLRGGNTGSSVSIHVKMPHCWKSHIMAHVANGEPYTVAVSHLLEC